MKKSEIYNLPLYIKSKSLLRIKAEHNRFVKKKYKINQCNVDIFCSEVFEKVTESENACYEICSTLTKDKTPWILSIDDDDIVWGKMDEEV